MTHSKEAERGQERKRERPEMECEEETADGVVMEIFTHEECRVNDGEGRGGGWWHKESPKTHTHTHT